jgi:MoaA/NifB/PqqE/SkfB family radical SAM enzyme
MNNTLESYLEDRKTKSKWLKIKKYSFLKESTYDVTSKCNIRCDGCYYFAGEKSLTKDQIDPEKWRSLFEKEKERGITFVVLAGAEPAIVPMICKSAYNVIPVGAIATNGIIKITDEVKYRIHISVWGDDEYSYKYRGVKNCLKKQIKAYANDDRAIFIYTITKHNIEQLESVTKEIVDSGFTISFNQFSSPVGYTGELTLDSDARHRMRDKISQLMETYREKIIYSGYNVEVHSHDKSLNDLFSCPYLSRPE